MQSSTDGPLDDPKMTELWSLYESKDSDWEGVLAGCPELLKLMPPELVGEGVNRRDKGLALKAALHEVIDRAYRAYRLPGEHLLTRKTLAGAAAIGLIDQSPDDLVSGATLRRAKGWLGKGERQGHGGKWHPARIGPKQFRENYLAESLQAFCDSLEAALQDDDFIHAVAGRVGKPFGVRGKELSKSDTKPGETLDKFDTSGWRCEAFDKGGADNLLSSQSYVHRNRLEHELLSLLRAHARIIVLAGPPSVGKRELARYMTNQHKPAGAGIMRIDGSSPQALQQSIYDGLIKAGIKPNEISDVVPQYSLKALMESSDALRYVIIENASDSELALFLADVKSETTIVVTTTKRLPGIDQKHCIKVGELELREAIELVGRLVPETPETDAAALAEELGHHVLAITVACGMVKHDDQITVATFCKGIERNAAVLFDGETDEYPALTQLYRRVLADLAETDPQALRALEMLVFLHGGSYIPSAFIVLSLGDAFGLTSANNSHLRAITRRTLSALKDRYLVNVHEKTYLTIPKLTQAIISQLVCDRGQELREHIRAGILEFISITRAELSDIPLKEFLDRHSLTMVHLATTYIDPQKMNGPVQYLQNFQEAISACMLAIGEDSWRTAVVFFQTSESSFTLTAWPLPRETDNIANMEFFISWNDPAPHRKKWIAKGWNKRKVGLTFVVDRSGALKEEIRQLTN